VKQLQSFPKDSFGWEAKIDGEVKYVSRELISKLNTTPILAGLMAIKGIRSFTV
jgi:hypothetical protein